MFTLNDEHSIDMKVAKQITPVTALIFVIAAVVDMLASITFPSGSMPAFSIAINKDEEGLVRTILDTIEPQFPQGIKVYSVISLSSENGGERTQRLFEVRSTEGGLVANKKVFYIIKKPTKES